MNTPTCSTSSSPCACKSGVIVPADVLASLIGMANSHIEDIETGIEDGTYDASDNSDLGEKQAAAAAAETLYAAVTRCRPCNTKTVRDKLEDALEDQARRERKAAGERNIFADALNARFISTSVSDREQLQIRHDLVAQEILGSYPAETVINLELYDQDSHFGECLIWMDRNFEFPDWGGRTVGEFLSKHRIPGEPTSLCVVQYTPRGQSEGSGSITLQQLVDATPLAESGWLLASGVELWFHRDTHA